MAIPLKVGDPVMVVFHGRAYCCIVEVTASGSFITSSTVTKHHRAMDDEGTTWLRGHRDENSPEVKAMIVAHKLSR